MSQFPCRLKATVPLRHVLWNATQYAKTGQGLTANQTAAVWLTPLEKAVTQFYVPMFVIFFAVLILYVLSKGGNNGGGGAYN